MSGSTASASARGRCADRSGRAGHGAVLLALALAAGCGRGPTSPRAIVAAFAEATRAGQAARAYQLLGPRTRARLTADAERAALSARRPFKPWELLAVGWNAPRHAASGFTEVSRLGERAVVEVALADGASERVELVREDGQWKIELL